MKGLLMSTIALPEHEALSYSYGTQSVWTQMVSALKLSPRRKMPQDLELTTKHQLTELVMSNCKKSGIGYSPTKIESSPIESHEFVDLHFFRSITWYSKYGPANTSKCSAQFVL